MNDLKKTATVIDKILKILRGITIAGIAVCAIFIPLTAILGEKIIADASSLSLGYLTLKLAGDYHAYLDMSGLKGSLIIMLSAAIVVLVVAFLAIRKLREIFAPMKNGCPFEEGISAKIRQLAWLVLIGGAVAEVGIAVAHVFEMRAIDLSLLFVPSAVSGITFDYPFSLWFIGAGLILLVLSYVFRYGEELQRESDETL